MIHNAFLISKCFCNYVSNIWDLVVRIYIFNVFFKSGWLSFKTWLDDDWQSTIYLFTEEFKVPILSPQVAAIISTFNEITFSILLLIGLFSRTSALMLLIMAVVIELTYMHVLEHILWIFLLSSIVSKGPGRLSLDALIFKAKNLFSENLLK